MSSVPPNPPPGGAAPNRRDGPLLKVRRPKADPLVRPKKRPIPRPPGQGQPAATNVNGAGPAKARPQPQGPPKPSAVVPPSANRTAPQDDLTVNGFSGPLLSENYTDYPLITTKRAWREGLKHHIAKFASKKSIDPRDESQFVRPVRLQRRDPRSTQNEFAQDKGNRQRGPGDASGGPTEAEKEELEAKKAAREKEREQNLAQIAPSAATGQKRTTAPKQRTQQVFKSEMTPQEMARAKIKYEEALPWHLEDFDNKATWVGNYEAAMSETYAMFVLQSDGRMRMVPIDKWYKFNAKNQFKTLSIEEVEKFMAKKIKDPRWFMEKEQDKAQKAMLENYAKQNKMFTGRKPSPHTGEGGFEGDDLDFEEDRFADDEEHVGLFDEDEDAKDAEKRIKSDQLKANIFDLKDEKIYEEEENQERKEKEALRNFGKKVRKALQKRERNFDYSSGSDANPYSDDESTEDSETERLKEEQRKAEEERKRREKTKDSDKNSGASTRGTNTPSGRPKTTDPLKKATSLAAKKRPGSPNLSDASGTDTSRKRPKNKHAAPQTSTPQPGSRPMSPSPSGTAPSAQQQQGKPSTAKVPPAGKKRTRNPQPTGSGSGSDAEKAGSGGEMSDSKVPKRLKINPPGVSSKAGSPRGSRAGSPVPSSARGNQTGTPTPGAGASPPPQQFPTPAEIHAAIPPTGISSSDLLKVFRSRLGDSKDNSRKFIAIVRDVSVYSKEDKLLFPGTLKDT